MQPSTPTPRTGEPLRGTAARAAPASVAPDWRTRLGALLAGTTEYARDLERGAASQPALEELLTARRASDGRALVLVLWSQPQALRAFLRAAFDLTSRGGVALDALPDHLLLHMNEPAGAVRSVLFLRQGSAQSLALTMQPAYARVEMIGADLEEAPTDPAEAGGAVIRITVDPEQPDGQLDGRVEWPPELANTVNALLAGEASSFWSSPVFADVNLVETLRLQRALGAIGRAHESLRRRLMLVRHDTTVSLTVLRAQDPRAAMAAGIRGGKDNALRLASETISELVSSVRERSRKAVARGSWLWSFQGNALNQIGPESIAREERRRVIRLSVNEEQIRGIEASFLRTFKGMLSKELEALRTELNGLCRALELQLALPRCSLTYDFPSDNSVWNDVAGYAAIDVRYRGEIPRRGFMERLAEGRKVVFLLLMIGSLAGSFVGFNLRQSGLIGLVCLALFVGTIAWSYKSWSDEELEVIDRETDKLTDLVETAIVKTTTDALREAANGVIAALENARKQLLGRVESALARARKEAEDRQAEDLRDVQARIGRAEALLKHLGSLEPLLQRQILSADALATDAARLLQVATRQAGAV